MRMAAPQPPMGRSPQVSSGDGISRSGVAPLEQLVHLAKLRWRVEHDDRELKDALGLDHFEGRSFKGWHHHVTLVSAAHAFVTLERLDPKAAASA